MFNVIERMAMDTYGMTTGSAIKNGICIRCKKPALVQAADGTSKYNPELFYSPAGKKEWTISAMCERCFDTMFDEEEQ